MFYCMLKIYLLLDLKYLHIYSSTQSYYNLLGHSVFISVTMLLAGQSGVLFPVRKRDFSLPQNEHPAPCLICIVEIFPGDKVAEA